MLRRLLLFAFAKPNSLTSIYGQTLTEVVYIQAFALIGRFRLGALADVERLVAPFVDGTRDSLVNLTASHLSGHLLFDELHRKTGKAVYRQRLEAAADCANFAIYNEMSDGVFMGLPLLARAGRHALALEHYQQLSKLNLRADGLWRHSPLCDAAWGRGNAFPALGLALACESMPQLRPDLSLLLETLLRWQTPNGMWRQVIDHPTAYEEYSATAMIASAMKIGVKQRWLNRRKFSPAIQRAEKAIWSRTSPSGELIDVCESTGKQKTLEDYLKRKAIRGRDPRGGAMALFLLSS